MHGEVIVGRLTLVDTDENVISPVSREDHAHVDLDTDADTKVTRPYSWEALVGWDVEAIAAFTGTEKAWSSK